MSAAKDLADREADRVEAEERAAAAAVAAAEAVAAGATDTTTPPDPAAVADGAGAGDQAAELEAEAAAAEELERLEAERLAAERAAAAGDVDIEKAIKQLQAEGNRHEKRVAEIMGADFAAYVPCEPCGTLGFVVAGAPALELEVDAETERCDRCKGRGQLITGSLVPGQETKPCPPCMGAGWVTKSVPIPGGALPPISVEQPAPWVPEGWRAVRDDQPA